MIPEFVLRSRERIDPRLAPFQESIKQAFTELIDDPENQRLLEAFRFTYETRKQYPWLDESEDREGLAGALTWTRHNYPRESKAWLKAKNTWNRMFKPVDDEFKNELKETVSKIVEDPTYINGFAFSLPYYGFSLETVDKGLAKDLVKNSLQIYWECTYAHGFSGDPW